MSTGHGRIGRRTVFRWVGRMAAASAVAVWQPGAFARAAPAKSQPQTRRTVALDPGHGGIDPGAIGITGSYEKDITLTTAEWAASLLQATPRSRAVLTPKHNGCTTLADRAARPLTTPRHT